MEIEYIYINAYSRYDVKLQENQVKVYMDIFSSVETARLFSDRRIMNYSPKFYYIEESTHYAAD